MAQRPANKNKPAAPSASGRASNARTTKGRPAPSRASRGRPAGLFTWIAVGLVLVVVAALVIVKVTSSSNGSTASPFQKTDAATLADLTTIPASVFDTVGITSAVSPVTPPIKLKSQSLWTAKDTTGATLPKVFYLGAEYCPFCAAERWATIIALSRFGTWKNLGNMISSTHVNEVYPGTPTFTFVKATYTSPYLVFAGVEQYTNAWSNTLGFYTPLQKPSKTELATFRKYDTTKWIPGLKPSQDYSIPFITFANQYLVSGSSYNPALLANQPRSQIAAGLKDPTSPVTDAIVATANYQTAVLCTLTKNQPGSVCKSTGVTLAKKAMGIK